MSQRRWWRFARTPLLVLLVAGLSLVIYRRYSTGDFSFAPAGAVAGAPRASAAAVFETEQFAQLESAPSFSNDWSQFRGPDRDGKSDETGLLQQWPSDGPPLVWQLTGIGQGYSTPSTSGPWVVAQGTHENNSAVYGISRADGALLWRTILGPAYRKSTNIGPGASPTIDGDRVYVLTAFGNLACLNLADGEILWRLDLREDLDGGIPSWGYNESPLVDGDRLFISPGGRNGTVAALNKMTGEQIWRSQDLNDGAAYSAWIVRDVGPHRAIMGFTAKAGVGVNAEDGSLLWRYEAPSNNTANCSSPVFDANRVLYSSAYGTGAGLLALTPTAEGVETEEAYFTKRMMNHFGNMILLDGRLYGASNDIFTCIDFETGEELWKSRDVSKCTLTWADGRLYAQTENANVVLVEPSPDGMKVVSHFSVPREDMPARATPVISDGRLFIRSGDLLRCYDIRAEAGAPAETPADVSQQAAPPADA